MKILFVVNPISGGNEKSGFAELVQTKVEAQSHTFKLYQTSGDDDHQKLADEIAAYQPDRIVAVGGDGTIQLVAKVLLEKKKEIPMGIIPMGSANGLAKSLELPSAVDDALDAILSSHRLKPMDLLRINDKYICVHLCDIGTNALLVKNFEEDEQRGMIGYAKHLIKSVQESELLQYEISVPGETIRKEGFMLALANAHKYGTGVHISDGSVSDGLFEICNVQKIDLESAIKAGLTIFNVFIDKQMFSDVIHCAKAKIAIRPQAHLQIDGEYIGEVTDLQAEIIKSPIKIIVPDAK